MARSIVSSEGLASTQRSGVTEPETTDSPRPGAPSITRRSRRRLDGSTVNITPARMEVTWRWTTTAMSMSAWPKPWVDR